MGIFETRLRAFLPSNKIMETENKKNRRPVSGCAEWGTSRCLRPRLFLINRSTYSTDSRAGRSAVGFIAGMNIDSRLCYGARPSHHRGGSLFTSQSRGARSSNPVCSPAHRFCRFLHRSIGSNSQNKNLQAARQNSLHILHRRVA